MAAETDPTIPPETIDIPEAVALMIGEGPDDTAMPVEGAAPEETAAEESVAPIDGPDDDAVPEGDLADGAPDFWTADDKALWKDVPETLRPVLQKYEQQRTAFLHDKTRDATQARNEAIKAAQAAGKVVAEAAAWWQQNGPAFHKAFADKWSGIDWKALAEKDPAEVQRLIKERHDEEALLIEANRRGQADIAAARQKAEQEVLEARQTEHAKLAERLPDYFGPERARHTYDALSRFLFAKGIPAEQIARIYEAPVIELALSAMRFEKAQQALRGRPSGEGGQASTRNPAKTTPTRIAPGPAARLDNRNSEAVRQVGERFRQGGGASIADAAELIRLSGL